MQQKLFEESLESAIKTDIAALGGAKVVGCRLWPEMDDRPDAAAIKLANCLNVDRKEKLDPKQVLWIKREAKKVGSFATVFYEMDDIGMSRPTPIEPEDEKAKLQREFITATQHMDQIMKRMERIQGVG